MEDPYVEDPWVAHEGLEEGVEEGVHGEVVALVVPGPLRKEEGPS